MHKQIHTFLVILILSLVTGCAGMGYPQNAEDLRKSARMAPSMLNKVRTFDVSRPFNEVSATLRKKSAECLNVSYEWHDSKGRHGIVTFKPTFIADKSHAELHVQKKTEGGTEIVIGGVPEGGLYRIVLDAAPESSSITSINLYVSSPIDDRFLANTVTDWVKGTNLGCPDFT